ncbi:hypothetical protein Q7P37_001058 [Cladosporium fusiforme]
MTNDERQISFLDIALRYTTLRPSKNEQNRTPNASPSAQTISPGPTQPPDSTNIPIGKSALQPRNPPLPVFCAVLPTMEVEKKNFPSIDPTAEEPGTSDESEPRHKDKDKGKFKVAKKDSELSAATLLLRMLGQVLPT